MQILRITLYTLSINFYINNLLINQTNAVQNVYEQWSNKKWIILDQCLPSPSLWHHACFSFHLPQFVTTGIALLALVFDNLLLTNIVDSNFVIILNSPYVYLKNREMCLSLPCVECVQVVLTMDKFCQARPELHL